MRRHIGTALVALAVFATPLAAQNISKDASSGTGVAANAAMFRQMSGYIAQVAGELSEADYAYKPVATVRSFGQIIGHVAGANYMFCAMALGEPPRNEGDIEQSTTTKAGLVAAIKGANDYCARAYMLSDAAASSKIDVFGQQQTKMYALALNAAHNAEHYGNIITYMRMKGMVPPSSR